MIDACRRCKVASRVSGLSSPGRLIPGEFFLFDGRDGSDGASEVLDLALEDFINFCVAARVDRAFAGLDFHLDAFFEVFAVYENAQFFRLCHVYVSLRAGLRVSDVARERCYEKRYGSSFFAGAAGCYSSVYVRP